MNRRDVLVKPNRQDLDKVQRVPVGSGTSTNGGAFR